jgi:hypothetical protein
MRNMAFKMVDRTFLVVYGAEDPTDAEWEHYVRDVERHGIERTMQLVFTEGGGPTPKQTARLERVLQGHTVPVAVVSPSGAVRAKVTAMSWFTRRLGAFAPSAIGDALAHLEMPASRLELVLREVDKLRLSLVPDKPA